jgi:hypothetical protein
MPVKKGKSTSDYMPVRKPPAGVKMPGTVKPKPKTPMPNKPGAKPKAETMPYKPSSRGGTSAGPVPSEISKGEQTRRSENQSSMNDKTSRTTSMAKKTAIFRAAAGKPMAKPTAKTPAKTTTKAPAKTTPKPKVTKKPEKMTPQDAAMKKILEKKYGKIYG